MSLWWTVLLHQLYLNTTLSYSTWGTAPLCVCVCVSMQLTVNHGDGRVCRRRTSLPSRWHSHCHRVLPVCLQVVQCYRGDAFRQPQRWGQLPIVMPTTLDLIGVKVWKWRWPGAGKGGGGERETVEGLQRGGAWGEESRSRRRRHIQMREF